MASRNKQRRIRTDDIIGPTPEQLRDGGAAAAAEFWMQQAKELQQTLTAVVFAAGGDVLVSFHVLHDLPDIELIKMEDHARWGVRFIARRETRST